MSRETIAVDIDDVLADHATAFAEFSNRNYGTNISRATYTEHWDRLWQIDDWDEILSRAEQFHTPEGIGSYLLIEGAQETLTRLAAKYTLAIVTARPRKAIGVTHDWLGQHFQGVFKEVHFVPIWEPNNTVSKADICQQINANYLIDDAVRHCNLAAESGIQAMLFGGFAWHDAEEINPLVTKVKDWPAVQEYFDARS